MLCHRECGERASSPNPTLEPASRNSNMPGLKIANRSGLRAVITRVNKFAPLRRRLDRRRFSHPAADPFQIITFGLLITTCSPYPVAVRIISDCRATSARTWSLSFGKGLPSNQRNEAAGPQHSQGQSLVGAGGIDQLLLLQSTHGDDQPPSHRQLGDQELG